MFVPVPGPQTGQARSRPSWPPKKEHIARGQPAQLASRPVLARHRHRPGDCQHPGLRAQPRHRDQRAVGGRHRQKTRKVLAIGSEAKEMVGRTPGNIVAIRPLRDGVISDFDVTEQMLHYFIHKVHEPHAAARPAATRGRRHPQRRDRGGEARRVRCHAQRRRARGLPDRRADGRGHRRGPARLRGARQHDRRHRRRHHRGGRHVAGRHRRGALDPRRGRRDGRGHHQLLPARSTTCSSASRWPSRSRSRPGRPIRWSQS